MASVTGYTAARMQEIEDSAIVGGAVVGDDLILTRYDTTTINAGNVRGPSGTSTLGTIGYAQIIANKTGITTVDDVAGLSVTWTALAGRRYRVSAQCKANSSVLGDAIKVAITDSSNTEISHSEIINQSTIAGQSMNCSAVIVPGAGSKTYKIRVQRSGGSGTVLLNAGATFPAYILVEDIGV